MSVRVDWYIAPTNPAAKAAALERNIRAGWQPVPGISDHEMGTVLRADHATAPLVKPSPPRLRPSRPSGWWPLWAVLGSVAGLAALVALVLP